MLSRLFVDHPRSVDETYLEHLVVAGRFGLTMIAGGIGVVIHAVVPGLFVKTGSSTIKRLNAIMVEQRGAKREHVAQLGSVDWVI